MYTKEELKEYLRPIVKDSARDNIKFAELSVGIAEEHFRKMSSGDINAAFDRWNDAVVELLVELGIVNKPSLH